MHKELRDLMGSAGVDSLLSSGPVLVNTPGTLQAHLSQGTPCPAFCWDPVWGGT